MTRLVLAALAAVGVFAVATPAAAAPAVAAPSADVHPSATATPATGGATSGLAIGLDGLKQAISDRLDARLTTLATLSTVISGAQHLTDAHRATLSALVATDRSRLTSLKAAAAGEQTIAALRADARSMVDDYRVYALVVPKVRLTIAADLATHAQEVLQQVHARLAVRATPGAAVHLADMQNQLSTASLAGVADALLAVPAGTDAKAIKSKVGTARSAVGTSRTALRKALVDAKAIRQLVTS